ncbi:hypothetical protein ACLB2K_073331 [Fragaria x ananassa]
MERHKRLVVCSENGALAEYMLSKWQETADKKPNGISENIEKTLTKAYSNVCNSKNPVKTLKEFSQVKGVGKWILKLMQGFFDTGSGSSEPEDVTKKGKRTKKRYVPQKNSVAYALLITLYRGTESGNEFMRKQELIDAAEASGLSRVPIMYFTHMGYSEERINRAISEASGTSHIKEISSIWPSVLCRLREDEVYGLHMKSQSVRGNRQATSSTHILGNGDRDCVGSESRPPNTSQDGGPTRKINSDLVVSKSSTMGAPSFPSCPVTKSSLAGVEASLKALSVPPLSFGEKFEDAYELIFVLDDREQLATQISRSRSIIESVISGCKITVEVRRLAVGDGIWIARHKHLQSEYVLDFIVERKNVDDLCCSIRDNRYRDQKLRLLRCGLKKLINLVEGDPNSCEAAESIKTACFTTELLEGFDVQRTGNVTETLRKYGYLTEAIFKYYKDLSEEQLKQAGVCPPFDEFNKRCQDLDKMTVSDVFAIQLMQVPQVTEEVAIAVLDLYPTVFSLSREYSLLEGDVNAQEEMLRTQSNNVVNAAASKNIFQFVWGID